MARKVTSRRPHNCGLCGKPIKVGIDCIQIWNDIELYSWFAHQCCYKRLMSGEPIKYGKEESKKDEKDEKDQT